MSTGEAATRASRNSTTEAVPIRREEAAMEIMVEADHEVVEVHQVHQVLIEEDSYLKL